MIHAQRRALQYLGVHLTMHELRALANRIQRNEEAFLSRESGNRTHWRVTVHGTPCIAVYDKARHAVVTFLSLEMFQETWVTGPQDDTCTPAA